MRKYYRKICRLTQFLTIIKLVSDFWDVKKEKRRFHELGDGPCIQLVCLVFLFVSGEAQYDYFLFFVEWLCSGCSWSFEGQCLDTCIISQPNIFYYICIITVEVFLMIHIGTTWYGLWSTVLIIIGELQVVIVMMYVQYWWSKSGYFKLIWRTNILNRAKNL